MVHLYLAPARPRMLKARFKNTLPRVYPAVTGIWTRIDLGVTQVNKTEFTGRSSKAVTDVRMNMYRIS
jgi:hypothetical protein